MAGVSPNLLNAAHLPHRYSFARLLTGGTRCAMLDKHVKRCASSLTSDAP